MIPVCSSPAPRLRPRVAWIRAGPGASMGTFPSLHAPMRLLVPALVALSLLACTRSEDSPFHGIDLSDASWGRSLRLPDLDGTPRTLGDFDGRYVLLTFGYTHCPEVCPLSLAKTAQVRRALGDAAGRVQVVFVTVDPGRDTPDVLQRYVRAFDREILALRGSVDETRTAANSFRASFRKVAHETGYAIDHTMLIYLIGPDQRLKLAFPHDTPGDEILADLKTLLAGEQTR